LSGEDVARCIQCGKCAGGCPVSLEMDWQPNQVLRFIQVNDPSTVLRSATLWLCASCRICSVRCPEEIDIARIMDTLRKLAIESGHAGEAKVVKFDQLFLDSIQKKGRIHELMLILRYNLAVREPLKDAHLGPQMLSRGKLGLFGHKIQELANIRGIFQRSKRFVNR